MCTVLHAVPSLKSAASEIVFLIVIKKKYVWISKFMQPSSKLIPTLTTLNLIKTLSATSRQPLPPASPLTERCASSLGIVSLPAEMLLQHTPYREGCQDRDRLVLQMKQDSATMYCLLLLAMWYIKLHKIYKLLVQARVIYDCARIRLRFNKRCRS